MYGRRRRPLLGAAVLVGASRMSARHEMERQATLDYQREMAIRQEVEAQKRQEAEQEKRTQRLVQEEVQKAVSANPNTASSSTDSSQQPLQQLQNSPPPSYPPAYRESNVSSGHATPTNSRQVSARDDVYNDQKAAVSTEAEAVGKTRHCTHCGVVCQMQDRFCWKCGAKHVVQDD